VTESGSQTIPFSPSCERNKDAILETIKPYLDAAKSVLEVGSGTAQHAVYFAQHCPNLIWQTSDQKSYLEGIRAQLKNFAIARVLPPIELDVNQQQWLTPSRSYDLIFTANSFHIMAWSDVTAFFSGLSQVSSTDTVLIVYGPFKYNGQFTSPSNAAFDENLRAGNIGGPHSAIREFEAVDELAKEQNFELLDDISMPANNQCLIWRRIGHN